MGKVHRLHRLSSKCKHSCYFLLFIYSFFAMSLVIYLMIYFLFIYPVVLGMLNIRTIIKITIKTVANLRNRVVLAKTIVVKIYGCLVFQTILNTLISGKLQAPTFLADRIFVSVLNMKIIILFSF